MTPPSSSQFLRAYRSHDLLLLASDHFPALELGDRTAFLDPDDVVHVVLVGLIVGVVFLRAPHRLLHDRVGKAALDAHDHGLILLVAHHDALERALRHLSLLRLRLGARGALRLGCWLLRRGGLWRRLRAAGALERRNRLDARDIAAHLAHARRVLELPRCPLEAQVELLLLELHGLVVELVDGHGPQIAGLHHQVLDHSAMRSTKRVLIGSLAAASASDSRASATDTPSISKMMRPGFTRAAQYSGAPLPEPMRTSSGFFDIGTSG